MYAPRRDVDDPVPSDSGSSPSTSSAEEDAGTADAGTEEAPDGEGALGTAGERDNYAEARVDADTEPAAPHRRSPRTGGSPDGVAF